MDTYNINDENFKNTETYQNFIKLNPSEGYLKIRAFAANQAIPISGLKIVITKIIENKNIVFFEGYTNNSGTIEKIILPTPKLDPNNLDVPTSTTYDITATYEPDNTTGIYRVYMYENIYVVQNISIVPEINMEMGGY